jgi:type I restriction enzyme, S subunit
MAIQESTKIKMKDSGVEWIGEIPDGWKIKSLRELFWNKKRQVGLTFNEYKLLRLSLHGVFPKEEGDSGKNPENYYTYQIFNKGDLVFCAFDYDVTPRTIGFVGEKGMMTSAYTRLIPNDLVFAKYYYYYYLALDNQKVLLHLCTGLRNTLGKHVLWKLLNPHPSFEKQKQIAEFLDKKTEKIDLIINKKKKLIELLKEKRASLITRTVTKGLDPNVKMKDSGVEWIGKIPEGWEKRKLKHVSHIETSGTFGNEVFGDVEAKLITTGHLSMSGKWFLEKMENKFFSQNEYSKFQNIYGDIVVVKSSGSSTNIVSGKAGFISEKESGTVFGNFLLRVRAFDIDSKFLYYFLTSHLTRERIELMCSSTTYPNLKVWEYISARILIPPTPTQKQIAEFLDKKTQKIDIAISKTQAQIKKLQEYKSSLIYHSVTGKIKI